MALLLFGIPLISSRWVLVAVMLALGVAAGVVDVGGNTLIVWLFGKAVGPYMNALHLFFGIGALLAPILADWVVVATDGIRWVYWILASLALPVLVWVFRTPSPSRAPGSDSKPATGTRSLQRYSLLVVMISLFFFLHTGTELSYGGWIFSYAVALQIGPDSIARLLNSAYWGGFTLGRVISIPLALRLRPQTMLLIDMIGAITSLSIVVLLPAWPPAIWIGTVGLGLSIASLFPSSLNFAERRMPISGKVTSYFLVGANAGAMVLPWVIGQLFESVGPQAMMWMLLGVVVSALGVLFVIARYSRRFETA
jgi:MFS transporter, FHS family, Na+ dependent glucose transporter 1